MASEKGSGLQECIKRIVEKLRCSIPWVDVPILYIAKLGRQFPGKKECIPDILVCSALAILDYVVQYVGNSVYKCHHFFLQALGCVSKVSNVTKAENGNDAPPREHFVHVQLRAVRVSMPPRIQSS